MVKIWKNIKLSFIKENEDYRKLVLKQEIISDLSGLLGRIAADIDDILIRNGCKITINNLLKLEKEIIKNLYNLLK